MSNYFHAIYGQGGTPAPSNDHPPVLLWTNPSPTNTFDGQTISLDLTEYVGVIIEFNLSGEIASTISRVYVKKNDNLTVASEFNFGAGCGANRAISRGISAINNEGITFLNGLDGISSASGSIIPIKIYGVKEYVVEQVIGDLLWSNDTPVDLSPSTIPGDFSNYEYFLVEITGASDHTEYKQLNFVKKDVLTDTSVIRDGYIPGYSRFITITNTNFTVGDGYSEKGVVNNSMAIPTKIYGINGLAV